MQIDWITVVAQIVNFLVLVWLLQRFLYGPITRAMKNREKRIENRLTEARQERNEAEDEAEAYRQKQRQLGLASEKWRALLHQAAIFSNCTGLR